MNTSAGLLYGVIPPKRTSALVTCSVVNWLPSPCISSPPWRGDQAQTCSHLLDQQVCDAWQAMSIGSECRTLQFWRPSSVPYCKADTCNATCTETLSWKPVRSVSKQQHDSLGRAYCAGGGRLTASALAVDGAFRCGPLAAAGCTAGLC